MELFLITLAGAGLLGCFSATLGIDMAGRGHRLSQRMRRPRSLAVQRD